MTPPDDSASFIRRNALEVPFTLWLAMPYPADHSDEPPDGSDKFYDVKPADPIPAMPLPVSRVLNYQKPSPPPDKPPRIAVRLAMEHQFLLGIGVGIAGALAFWHVVFKTRVFLGMGWVVALLGFGWLVLTACLIISDRFRGLGLGLLVAIPVSVFSVLMICGGAW